MAGATVVEAIAQLRAEGKSDDEIEAILRRSKIEPPPGYVMGEDAAGLRPDGRQCGANR